jgi:hypothetical protein
VGLLFSCSLGLMAFVLSGFFDLALDFLVRRLLVLILFVGSFSSSFSCLLAWSYERRLLTPGYRNLPKPVGNLSSDGTNRRM